MSFRAAILSATLASASLLAIAPAAHAAASTAMPTCAAGDPVVWENTHSKSKVFHVQGDKYYGNTKNGVYACESAATTAGYHGVSTKGAPKTGASAAPAVAPAADSSAAPSAVASPAGRHHRHRGSATPAPAPAAT